MDPLVREKLHGALSALYSAGTIPDPDQYAKLRAAALRAPGGADDVFGPRRREILAEVLIVAGFEPDLTLPAPLLFPSPFEPNDYPRPGHLVRLLSQWGGAGIGALLTLSGPRDGPRLNALRIGAGRHYWGGHDGAPIYLSSGGPASIVCLKLDRLVLTGERGAAWFWRFRSSPEAHSGVDYVRTQMPIWEWAPAGADDWQAEPQHSSTAPTGA